ncbi:MAG: hypothetical protein EZS28_044134 [Streblomastix strix]|uniref:Uncharacterized protein n=1 Tax=Streblomastix strix TaxID=222440 RepID=A0A5J4TR04_9EUKA|nr:MAG: hypothetical protein EZS28_044134 [Streblomastix strix]
MTTSTKSSHKTDTSFRSTLLQRVEVNDLLSLVTKLEQMKEDQLKESIPQLFYEISCAQNDQLIQARDVIIDKIVKLFCLQKDLHIQLKTRTLKPYVLH